MHYSLDSCQITPDKLGNFPAVIINTLADFKEVVTDLERAFPAHEVITIDSGGFLDINTIRDLQSQIALRSLKDRLFIVRAERFPQISQNAMLKMLEDVPRGLTIILVVKPSSKLLETVLSRAIQIKLTTSTEHSITELYQQLYDLPLSKRFDYWEEIKDDNLLGELCLEVITNMSKQSSPALPLLELYEGWQNGAILPKYLFEYLCLILPKKLIKPHK